ncbi:MAG: AMP phosphorylase [Nanoarchaeota archaeon]|nr:AMP phosphorylase [Nanoarchaeota archaeon]MBU4242213.1 AMP phosphorylase [Nanoarchaeota archaeon]MBU4352051.1 AMP phosphorylase [Nanoarchaeota archaeon]MBU4455906.1 AMP phosphorylase [Nanoarchaeota archaeon]MCG2720178.1 AMP phosphorylase [Nanoarchaeota archaeon]
MKLKIKDVDIASGDILVAILNEKDALELGIQATDRIKIKRLRSNKHITAVVDIATSIKQGQLGLFEEGLKLLNLKDKDSVEVTCGEPPKSIILIKDKLDGKRLTEEQINLIIEDIIENRFSDKEMTYFVSACYIRGLNLKETVSLTKSIVNTGTKIDLGKKIVLDKHCIGGIPNNRTTMIVIPILASLGYTIPKTSSRSITSPAGTADTMEVLAPVALSEAKIKSVVSKTNACIVWGGNTNLAAADDKLIKVRHPLKIDPEGMLLASILAKKKAVGATHVLIDIPYGYGAKFENKRSAKVLSKKFIKLGELLGMKIKVILTDGSQPIGNGVGPVLEAMDILSVLKSNGPNDLRAKAIYMATELLKMLRVKNAKEKVIETLNSGKAYDKFMEIIKAQGGKKHFKLQKAKFFHSVLAKKDGKISSINNKGISTIARRAGAPQNKAAGLYLRVHKNQMVKKGEVLFTIYARTKEKLQFAITTAQHVEHIVIN